MWFFPVYMQYSKLRQHTHLLWCALCATVGTRSKFTCVLNPQCFGYSDFHIGDILKYKIRKVNTFYYANHFLESTFSFWCHISLPWRIYFDISCSSDLLLIKFSRFSITVKGFHYFLIFKWCFMWRADSFSLSIVKMSLYFFLSCEISARMTTINKFD